jgi:hypothetical protein
VECRICPKLCTLPASRAYRPHSPAISHSPLCVILVSTRTGIAVRCDRGSIHCLIQWRCRRCMPRSTADRLSRRPIAGAVAQIVNRRLASITPARRKEQYALGEPSSASGPMWVAANNLCLSKTLIVEPDSRPFEIGNIYRLNTRRTGDSFDDTRKQPARYWRRAQSG